MKTPKWAIKKISFKNGRGENMTVKEKLMEVNQDAFVSIEEIPLENVTKGTWPYIVPECSYDPVEEMLPVVKHIGLVDNMLKSLDDDILNRKVYGMFFDSFGGGLRIAIAHKNRR